MLGDVMTDETFCYRIALVSLALWVGGFIGFITMGLNAAFCSSTESATGNDLTTVGDTASRGQLGINGWMVTVSNAKLPDPVEVGYNIYELSNRIPGYDITTMFTRTYPACQGRTERFATLDPCNATLTNGQKPGCVLGDLSQANIQGKGFRNTTKRVGFGWDDVSQRNFTNFLVSFLSSALSERPR